MAKNDMLMGLGAGALAGFVLSKVVGKKKTVAGKIKNLSFDLNKTAYFTLVDPEDPNFLWATVSLHADKATFLEVKEGNLLHISQ